MGRIEEAESAAPASTADREPEELAAGAAGSSPSAASAPAASTLRAVAADLEFYLAVEIHYHRARQAWLSAAHRWMMFIAILFGSGAATAVAPALCGLLAALTAAADLAFDFPGRAAQHADLARQYLGLAQRLGDGDDVAIVQRAMLEVSGGEPPVYNVAREMAHNLAIASLGRDPSAKIVVPESRRWLAHLFRFDNPA
jgi:hypothetical protein